MIIKSGYTVPRTQMNEEYRPPDVQFIYRFNAVYIPLWKYGLSENVVAHIFPIKPTAVLLNKEMLK